MAGVVIASAVSVFLGGLVMGVIAVIAIAVRREDRRYTLAVEAPDRLSRNTRRLTGVRRRDLDAEFLRPVSQVVHYAAPSTELHVRPRPLLAGGSNGFGDRAR